MSTFTANYNLTKPAVTENYNRSIDNTNLDLIDSALKALDTAYKAADTALDGRLDDLEGGAQYTALTLGTNFQRYNNDADYQVGYRVFAGNKRVDLQGTIWRITSNLAYAANTNNSGLLATLPAAIRPFDNMLFCCAAGGIGSARNVTLAVNADGTVVWATNAAGTWNASDAGQYISLAGVGWWIG